MSAIRTIRCTVLGAAFLVGASTAASAQPPAPTGTPQGDVRRAPDGRTDRTARRGPGGRRGPNRALGRALGRALFRDIALTEAQRTQVQAIQQKYAAERTTFANDVRAKAGATRGERPDSATRAQLRARLQTEGRAMMERQIAELRAVLTAEQRATFDKNVATSRERLQAQVERAKAHGGERRRAFGRGA